MRAAPTLLGTLALMGTIALATGPAAGAAPTAPQCQPSTLNESAALAGGAVTVSPTPDSLDASYRTQISFMGVPAPDISDVRVSGSASGVHTGQLAAYSQGDGASFIPDVPFGQGEVVTIRAILLLGGRRTPIAWRFTTAVVDAVSRSLETPPPPPPPPNPAEFQHFLSRPDLTPPTVTVTTDTGAQAPGDLLLAPYAGPGQYGPMILDATGKLLWFSPLQAGARAADLRVQEYEGRPVLTWWEDPLVAGGHRGAGVVIANASYETVQDVRAGNGYEPDLHAFKISPQGTAIFTVYDAIRCNLSRYGGPTEGAVADTLAQEIDLRTGLVRFEWHSLDHVALSDSYVAANAGNGPRSPWDFFHINAIEPQPGGAVLINSRNTWAAYQISERSGQILWRLGGKHSTFRLGPGAMPAWQHDARELPGGIVTFFDNGGTPKVHPQSRGLVLKTDLRTRRATLLRAFVGSKPLLAGSQGDLQPLADGNWLAGWGQEPYLSEFSPSGQVLLEAHLPPSYQSFTVFRLPWSGAPTQPPAVVVRNGASATATAYASWNGATAVAGWLLLGGDSPATLGALGPPVSRSGFETALPVAGPPAYVAVEALGAQGQVLGTSPAVSG